MEIFDLALISATVIILCSFVYMPISSPVLSAASGGDVVNSNSTGNATSSGVDLVNTRPLPTDVKTGSQFEILSTVVNNSPDKILLPAGRCSSPLTAFFMSFNVVIRHTQGCTATSPPFELSPGEQVTVAGPVSGTIYQAIKAGKTPATATVYYLTDNGEPRNVTKSFAFTIN
jgi:hypothetical protein